MTTLKNENQIRREKSRLKKRKEELQQKINSQWSSITGNSRPEKARSGNRQRTEMPLHQENPDDDRILATTLAYAGSLLGHRLGIWIEDKVKEWLDEEE